MTTLPLATRFFHSPAFLLFFLSFSRILINASLLLSLAYHLVSRTCMLACTRTRCPSVLQIFGTAHDTRIRGRSWYQDKLDSSIPNQSREGHRSEPEESFSLSFSKRDSYVPRSLKCGKQRIHIHISSLKIYVPTFKPLRQVERSGDSGWTLIQNSTFLPRVTFRQ